MSEELKDIVRVKYNQIATQSKETNESSCCGSTGCCDNMEYTIMSDDYSGVEGYSKDADLGLGCGIPTEYAGISKNDTVIDLGSGAGNDAFVARSIVGASGKVFGIDFAGAMLTKARNNTVKLGYKNIEFIKGDIENMPFDDELANVIISNCVLNLVPDKRKAFSEIFRVLKPGGHFCVSDIVLSGELPDELLKDAEMYAGCVAGAPQKNLYMEIINETGFQNIEIKKEKEIILPESVLTNYLTIDQIVAFKTGHSGIFSITVIGYK